MCQPVVLHVEDEADDALFVQRAFRKTRPALQLRRVADGQQALDYLRGAGDFADRGRFPLPQLVLLDLKLPFVHGFDVLAWVRAQAQFKQLPVIVLSGSGLEEDRRRASLLGATSYFVKSSLYRDVVQFADGLLGSTPAS